MMKLKLKLKVHSEKCLIKLVASSFEASKKNTMTDRVFKSFSPSWKGTVNR